MNTNQERLTAYREKMKYGQAAWQGPRPKLEEPSFDNVTPNNEFDNIPGLKRVSELQFGDIFRRYEGPLMGENVQPHQGWSTFVGVEPRPTEGFHTLKSTRLGHPKEHVVADIETNHRFQVLPKEVADQQDIVY
jgi:hypothetical protein